VEHRVVGGDCEDAMLRTPASPSKLAAVGLPLKRDSFGCNTNLLAPEPLQLAEILVCVVLDPEIQRVPRESPDPSSTQNDDSWIGVADGNSVAVSLGAFADVQTHEVPEGRIP
jgi:hypothetical protein